MKLEQSVGPAGAHDRETRRVSRLGFEEEIMKEKPYPLSVVTIAAIVVAAGALGGGLAETADVTRTEEQLLHADVLAESDLFGYSVATDGSTALIGAVYDDLDVAPFHGNAGAVYVFERTGETWLQVDRLVASDAINSGFFGRSVAISGDTAIIGANGVSFKRGAAYVFVRDGGVWTEQQKLVDASPDALDNFGYSVAIDGDTAVIGAFQDDHGMMDDNRGSAFVFTRSGTTWTFEQRLRADVPNDDDWFGYRVAVKGDTAVVGAIEDESEEPYRTGSAYVFTRSGTTWTQVQKLNGSSGTDDRNFGSSLGLDGNTLVVGSNQSTHAGIDKAGAAYVFTETGGVWSEQQQLTASDKAELAGFGNAALAGDTILVSADLADHLGVFRAGKAYIFNRSEDVWTERQMLVPANPEDQARVGLSIALAPDAALLGAAVHDAGTVVDAGAVLSYDWAALIFADGFESGDTTAW